jgi:hypothetical protein
VRLFDLIEHAPTVEEALEKISHDDHS